MCPVVTLTLCPYLSTAYFSTHYPHLGNVHVHLQVSFMLSLNLPVLSSCVML